MDREEDIPNDSEKNIPGFPFESQSASTEGDGEISFIVQFFGVHEITDSFQDGNLLVSTIFKDLISSIDKIDRICFYFVFHEIRSFVGTAIINTEKLQVMCQNRVL